MPVNREETVNDRLAECLREMLPGWSISAEQERAIHGGGRPDIVVTQRNGLPVVLETEFYPARTVDDDANSRLGRHLVTSGREIEQCLSVRIPRELKSVSQDSLREYMRKSEFEYATHTLSASGESTRWPNEGWITGNLTALADCVEIVSLSESRITQGADILQKTVGQTANLLKETQTDKAFRGFGRILHQEAGEQTNRMAVAIVANAVMFHHQLVELYNDIEPLESLRERNPLRKLLKMYVLDEWSKILNENYWPIFRIASDLLIEINDAQTPRVLTRLSEMVTTLSEAGAVGIQDLSGRMFQTLISDRKFLASFYTLPPSAALLAELAVARLDVDWSNKQAVAAVRVADFACGTGALLGATYTAMAARHRRTGGDDANIHAEFMEHVLTGIDIMPAATHLTAATLAGAHPNKVFGATQIITASYGEGGESYEGVSIGSLELLNEDFIGSIFGSREEVLRGDAGVDRTNNLSAVAHGSLDLVIMNPPFTSPTGHKLEGAPNPAFAAFKNTEDEQKQMSARLKKIRTKLGRRTLVAGHGNAGLATDFIDLAHAKLKSGGIMAMVLPATILQGASWQCARELLEGLYENIAIVCIASDGPTDRAFSADTNIAEVLIVAKRRDRGEDRQARLDQKAGRSPPSNPTHLVNLPSRPKSLLEAKETARGLAQFFRNESGGRSKKITEVYHNDLGGYTIKAQGLGAVAPCGGVKSEVIVRIMSRLKGLSGDQRLLFPNSSKPVSMKQCPLTLLNELGMRGPVHRDVTGKTDGKPRGPFERMQWKPDAEYPMLWEHDASKETCLVVQPDSYGWVRSGYEGEAADLWDMYATRLHMNLDFRLNSQPLAACFTEGRTIGGTAWPSFVLGEQTYDESGNPDRFNRRSEWEIPLLLWMNTTFGLMSFWWTATRSQMGRARLTVTTLGDMPCLDVRKLGKKQINYCEKIFDEFRDVEFKPANEAYRDKARQTLDGKVLHDLLEIDRVLVGRDHLGLVRSQWCREPSVHGGKETKPKDA